MYQFRTRRKDNILSKEEEEGNKRKGTGMLVPEGEKTASVSRGDRHCLQENGGL